MSSREIRDLIFKSQKILIGAQKSFYLSCWMHVLSKLLLYRCTVHELFENLLFHNIHRYFYLINNPRMFNGAIFDLAEKPYIPQKILLEWICCKCLAGCDRHSFFWPQRSWRLLEAKNTFGGKKYHEGVDLLKKVLNESFSAPSKTPWRVQSDSSYDLR